MDVQLQTVTGVNEHAALPDSHQHSPVNISRSAFGVWNLVPMIFLQASQTEKLTPFILTASSYMRCTSILSLQMLRQEHFSGNTHSGPAPAFLFDHQTTQNAKPPK